jgi:tetratricopeptide (TPR) repeat protein
MERLKALLSFLDEDPNDPFTMFAIAQEYAKLGEHDEALRFYQRLVHEHPRYVGTYLHLGNLYRGFGRLDDAVSTFESGIAVANEISDFHARSELQDALMNARLPGWDD